MTPATETEALWHAHRAALLNYVKRRADDEAEDIVQDVYLAALEAMQRGGGYTRHASGWLHRIAHNRIIDGYRARDRAPQWVVIDEMVDADDGDRGRQRGEVLVCDKPGPDEIACRRVMVDIVRGLTKTLSDEQAAVFNRRMDGADFEEIAAELGKGIGAVKAIQHRALVALRPRLDPKFRPAANTTDRLRMSPLAKRLRDLLAERGPLTARMASEALGATHQGTCNTFRRHRHVFAVTGLCAVKGFSASVWGLVGIHSTQEAA